MMNSLIMELEKKKNGGRLVNHHMITAEVAAEKWGVSKRRVNQLCSSGEIAGARKEGQSWVIPANAKRPIDKRKKKVNGMPDTNIRRLPLPVGVSEYRLASDRYYYIDKTMLIKEFLDEQPMVSLFTRPRRFGKTLNMDMLRVFLKKAKRIPPSIFKIKRFGVLEIIIVLFRESIRLFFCHLKILNMIHGKKLSKCSLLPYLMSFPGILS